VSVQTLWHDLIRGIRVIKKVNIDFGEENPGNQVTEIDGGLAELVGGMC